jgi:DNA-binding GntR family transcriptional regulator
MSDPAIGDDDRAPFPIDEWPYIVLADRLEERVRRGEFGGDGKLPVTGELAEWYGVKVGVIGHARQELVRRNLAVFRLGQGYFARGPVGLHPGS